MLNLFLADWGFLSRLSLGMKQFQPECGVAPAIMFPVSFSGRK